MAQYETGRRSKFSWITVARIVVSAAFLFWIYIIWNSTTELNGKLNAVTDRYSTIHNLQVDFKTEIQEWKNVLLRSNSRDSLDKSWRTFEAQHAKVAVAAQNVIKQNSEVRAINERMKAFTEGHAANFLQYKSSVDILIKSGFDPHAADAAVKGIDRPLLDYLEAAEVAMDDEKKSINENLTAKARDQIGQSLLVLCLIALLVVWMPKW